MKKMKSWIIKIVINDNPFFYTAYSDDEDKVLTEIYRQIGSLIPRKSLDEQLYDFANGIDSKEEEFDFSILFEECPEEELSWYSPIKVILDEREDEKSFWDLIFSCL